MKQSISASQLFIQHSAHLLQQYQAWIERALQVFPSERLWWKPNPQTNALGHLLKHMEGNLRQWVIHGLGGQPDIRQRAREFKDTNESLPELHYRLNETITQALRVIKHLSEENLLRTYHIQGFTVSGLEALYHAVEHFAYHTGQVVYLTKMFTGQDLQFYRLGPDGHPKPHW